MSYEQLLNGPCGETVNSCFQAQDWTSNLNFSIYWWRSCDVIEIPRTAIKWTLWWDCFVYITLGKEVLQLKKISGFQEKCCFLWTSAHEAEMMHEFHFHWLKEWEATQTLNLHESVFGCKMCRFQHNWEILNVRTDEWMSRMDFSSE